MSLQEPLLLGGMALVTFSIRYILFALADHFKMPAPLERALFYVPPAVLTAILVPEVLKPGGEWSLTWRNPYLLGALAALAGGLVFKKNILMGAIVTGLAVFFSARFFF